MGRYRWTILAALRLGIGLFYPPSRTAPEITNIRYDLVDRNNPLAGHSITDLACGLYRIARLPGAGSAPSSSD